MANFSPWILVHPRRRRLNEKLEENDQLKTEIKEHREKLEAEQSALMESQAEADVEGKLTREQHEKLVQKDAIETAAAQAVLNQELQKTMTRLAVEAASAAEISEQVRNVAAAEIQRIMLLFKAQLRIHRQEQVVSGGGARDGPVVVLDGRGKGGEGAEGSPLSPVPRPDAGTLILTHTHTHTSSAL